MRSSAAIFLEMSSDAKTSTIFDDISEGLLPGMSQSTHLISTVGSNSEPFVRASIFTTRAFEHHHDYAGGIVIMDIRQAA
jgi:hypothetical protein